MRLAMMGMVQRRTTGSSTRVLVSQIAVFTKKSTIEIVLTVGLPQQNQGRHPDRQESPHGHGRLVPVDLHRRECP